MLLLALVPNAYSQCAYHSTDSTGNAISENIPCNFPVYVTTGDPAADGERFQTELNAWTVNNKAYPEFGTGMMPIMSSNYITIPQAEFDLFAASKKNIVTAFPNTFRVSQ